MAAGPCKLLVPSALRATSDCATRGDGKPFERTEIGADRLDARQRVSRTIVAWVELRRDPPDMKNAPSGDREPQQLLTYEPQLETCGPAFGKS